MTTECPEGALAHGQDAPGAAPRRPRRTCVGCRRRGERSVLIRLVVTVEDGVAAVVHDPRRRMPGRGAWLHPDEHCLDLARRRTALTRALRLSGSVDTVAVIQQVAVMLQDGARHPGRIDDPGDQRADRPIGRRENRPDRQNADEHPMSKQR